jgi:hypothetical protein
MRKDSIITRFTRAAVIYCETHFYPPLPVAINNVVCGSGRYQKII